MNIVIYRVWVILLPSYMERWGMDPAMVPDAFGSPYLSNRRKPTRVDYISYNSLYFLGNMFSVHPEK